MSMHHLSCGRNKSRLCHRSSPTMSSFGMEVSTEYRKQVSSTFQITTTFVLDIALRPGT